MVRIQSLLCLLTGLALCAAAVEVTVLPDTAETETANVTERSFTEAQTQIPEKDVNVTTHYDSSTEGFLIVETVTQSLENSTYTVLIEDPEGALDYGTLIGIVAGIVSMIGVSAMIVILIVRKMGRYSP
ncbi:podoplanin isoform X2 [Pyxicephalus adspersus]|uniref:podoplanin isoform X2 n=1 Tax=Pyxicephalus adspersus TaxID=30357 RepID=UPI003B5C23C5